jgi:hypothetical protein
VNQLLRTDNWCTSCEIYDNDDDDDDEVRFCIHLVVFFVRATCPPISVLLITLILLQLD